MTTAPPSTAPLADVPPSAPEGPAPARSSPPPGRREGALQLLADPNIRRLWLAQAWSAAGEVLAQIALPLFVYSITESAALVGFIALLLVVPRVVLAPVVGLLVDRVDRRRLIILADFERLALVLLVPFATNIWQISLLALGLALGNAVSRPAELALVPAVAGPARLVSTLSLSQVTTGILRVVIPAAGAIVIATTGPTPAFYLQAVCFVGSLLAVRRLVVPVMAAPERSPDESAARRALREMWEGLRACRDLPIVRGIVLSEMLWQLVVGALVVTAVVYTQETLRLGDEADGAFALMTTALSAGAVLGALIAHRAELLLGRPRLMAIGYLGPLAMVVGFWAPPMPVMYVAWFALGFADAWAVIAFQSYLAEAVDDALRGRVYAMFVAIAALAAGGAYSLLGVVTPWLGAPLTFGVVGLLVGLGGPLVLWVTGALPEMRRQSAARQHGLAAPAES